ncbi:DeoR/GlpR family DNA-binding transcription regulator [Winogradskya consettensis]|uniref:DeoR family transcriptional regulator n=1 Tax=Winogradskya consettensis TaxID=113560 RepID=A0A919SK10_9ACTN|nr:DeoR/GlpR family DNA-binding transcription regulator [Actinoplanes consettensis]GIM73139.1 DeoR family transcriptional regulator [Actinoplanes consettensis]
MQRAQRLNAIVARVVDSGEVEVATLAEEFDVSLATIRRDIDSLQRKRLVTRTHGGVRPHDSFYDLPLSLKSAQDLAEKRRIAQRALEFVDGARVIGMTGGTTVTEFARGLLDRQGLTIVTNALNVATDLLANPGLRVFAAGGEVRPSSQEVIGPSAETFLAEYNLDVAIVGVDGVDARAGCTNYDPAGSRVNRVLVQRAKRVIVLADASKIGHVALAPVCTLAQVDILLTDTRLPPADAEALATAGCKVLRA